MTLLLIFLQRFIISKKKDLGTWFGAQTCLVISMAIISAIPVPACKKVNISTVKKMHSLILMRTKENGDCLCSLQTVKLFSICTSSNCASKLLSLPGNLWRILMVREREKRTCFACTKEEEVMISKSASGDWQCSQDTC
jgi:hypothetical protein